MEFLVKKFDELTINELYAIFQLRSEVFVVEQDCVYQDLDFKDQKALHVFGLKMIKLLPIHVFLNLVIILKKQVLVE